MTKLTVFKNFSKNNFLKKIFFRKNIPFLLASSLTFLTTLSGYVISQNASFLSSQEHNYLSKIRFTFPKNQFTSNDKNILKIEGNLYDISNQSNLQKIIDENITRLNSFYKKYSPEKTVVNFSVSNNQLNSNESFNLPEFYVHTQSYQDYSNLNNLWFANVKLNQMSIDRYGYKYDSEGKELSSSSTPELVNLVSWSDVGLKEMQFNKSSNLLEFNVFKDISKDEVKIMINEDDSKYKISQKSDEVTNNWYVWLDKDLLSIKLNYFLQTYVFNNKQAQNEEFIKKIIGNDESRDSKQTKSFETIQKNFNSMAPEEKEFAENYINEFISNSEDATAKNWSDIVNFATKNDSLIKPQDLNKIYNKFTSKSKSTKIFTNHLISVLKAGDKETIKKHFDLKILDNLKINGIATYSDENKESNKLKISVDNSINFNLTSQELYELLTKYSVRYFNFDIYENSNSENKNNQIIYPNLIYSSSENLKDQAISVFHIEKKNDYSFYKNFIAILICGILFFICVGFLIFKNYKIPGLISLSGLIAALINSFAIFFILGSKFSLVGFAAVVVSFFYGLFLIIYFLDFLRKLFKITFLDKNSVFLAFNKNLLFSVDFSLVLFIFSSLVSFLAPPYLREFGIFLSVFVLVMFFLLLVVNFLSISYINKNFLKVREAYKRVSVKKIFFLNFFEFLSSRNKFLIFSTILIIFSIVGITLFNSFGFNSFSLFKDNFLVTFLLDDLSLASGKKLEEVKKILAESEIEKITGKNLISWTSENINSYLVQNSFKFNDLLNLFKQNLKTNSYSIQKTSAFSGTEIFNDCLKVFLFSTAFISIYVFIRFGFFNLLNLWINISGIIFFFFSLLSLMYVFINQDIFLVFLGLFSFALLKNIFLFNSLSFKLDPDVILNKTFIKGLRKKALSLKAKEMYLIFSVMFLFFFSFLWSTSNDLILFNIYISFSFFIVYFLSQYFMLILWEKFYFLKSIFLTKIFKNTDLSKKLNILNEYKELEEEKIEGINSHF